MEITVGMKGEVDSFVEREDTAKEVGSGSLLVYATPCMVALMEGAACEAIEEALGEDKTTVGTALNIEHISATPVGQEVDAAGLRLIMEDLIKQGADNIDLVTPTHYLPTVAEALEQKLPVPVVYNCGGYERPEMLKFLEGKVDIYLPDLKYGDNALGAKLSDAGNYVQYAAGAIKEMFRQTGPVRFEGERMVSGVIIRHLVLPGHVESSLKVLDWIGENFAPGEVLVSLMGQYTPMPGMKPPLDRRVTQEEYDAVLSWMMLNDLEGFTQEISAADGCFIPDF